ncbi:DDE-type integrase/transposase/recombinase [Aestuariibacter salexigens]|uniref:DDE-type integrase/transposase/recombinase n=1 Tax=Aestuariibacter salexigens TaxID=226010 RepID=UPI00040514BC|nr:DDE-type integrase/transposase/recombinase [Aestuariibacter salexigens]
MLNKTTISERRACKLAGMDRMTWRYKPKPNMLNEQLSQRLCELAKQRLRFGSPRLTVLIRREFGAVNHKRIERLYAQAELQIPRRKRRSRVGPQRQVPLEVASRPKQRWSMDFVHDALYDGTKFRVFNLVDDYTRESVAIEVDTSLSSERLIRIFERLRADVGLPEELSCDNGLPFKSTNF